MLSNYLKLIAEQRLQNPLHPKDYRLNSLPKFTKTSHKAIEELVRWSNSQFTGVIERQIPLYPDVNDTYYYEFVDLGVRTKTDFTDWKFFYIPVSKYDDLIAAARTGILPSYKVYNVDTASVDTILTKSPPLTPFTRPNSTFFNLPIVSNLHPLLSNFIFTGHSFLDKQGFMIYEYNDFKKFMDDITVTYYSKLRPLNFFIPSSLVEEYALEDDFSNLSLISKPPSYLELYTNLPTLKFSGKSTTQEFNKFRKWYEYNRYIDGFPFDTVILPYAPTPLSIDFVNVEVNNASMSLVFNQVINTQSLSLNQVSSNNKISLQ